MNIGLLLTFAHITIVLLIFGTLFWFSGRKIFRVLKEGEKSPWKRAMIKAVSLPVKFIGDFFRDGKESRLPFYIRWFNKFTRICSRIPYFHFLPKFLIALSCELSVSFITGHELLTGVIFLWSFSFFLFITTTESMMGELEEDAITLANKIFLRTSIGVTLVAIVIGRLFWEPVRPFFENGFWEMIATISTTSNRYLKIGFEKFWELPIFVILGVFVLLFIFIAVSLANPKK